MYDYRGCIHVHSTHSDGAEDAAAIMRAANAAGLDFVVLTDHDTLRARREGLERWHESALLIAGVEITPEENHLIAFGEGDLADVESLRSLPPAEFARRVREAGWLGFIAHPYQTGAPEYGVAACPWTAWEAAAHVAGISIWDAMTDFLGVLADRGANPELVAAWRDFLTGPSPAARMRLDAMALDRPVVAIGELDNHARRVAHEGNEFVIFPHEEAFTSVVNHVLLDRPLERDPAAARRQIIGAIAAGRLYVALDAVADPSEFVFEVEEGDRTVPMGGTLEMVEHARAVVSVPQPATIRVLHNGEPIEELEGAEEAMVEIEEPGVVRVEVELRGRPWIFSNPVRVVRAS
jgi:hypothetical protein